MRNLRAKLDLLARTPGQGSPLAPQKSKPLQNSRGRSSTREFEARDQVLAETLGATVEDTKSGPLLVIRRHHPIDQKYGRASLNQALGFQPSFLQPLYPGLHNHCLRRALFFDTETTGLAGGSGTYAFLVGIGFFQDNSFSTEQLLMRDFSDEPALLAYLEQRLTQYGDLVSFNGKSFDSQLLITRFAMHRRKDPLSHRSHFDMLHFCRRLWKSAPFPDCRLETLERLVLRAPRHGDVPGYLIPELYFQFLRDRNPQPLKGIVEHNRRDLLAMVALCSHVQSLLDLPPEQAAAEHPESLLGLARLWEKLGNWEKCDRYFNLSLANLNQDSESRLQVALEWSRSLKKRKDDLAAKLWRSVLTRCPGHPEATVELAKWLEHNRKDYRRALTLVEGSLRSTNLQTAFRAELTYRAQRLRRRLLA